MTVTRARAARLATADATLSEILHLLAPYVSDLRALAIVGACSRDCRYAVEHIIAENAPNYLIGLTNAAVACFDPCNLGSVFRLSPRIRWVATATVVGPDTVRTLIETPNVPFPVILSLLRSGVCFSYEQLIEAAKKRIVDLEVWVTVLVAYQDLLKAWDHPLPKAVIDMYTKNAIDVKDLNPSNITELLHLAINTPSNRPAAAVAVQILGHLLTPSQETDESCKCMQQQVTPDIMQHLLLTAVARGHFRVINQLSQFPAVLHLSAEAVQECCLRAIRLVRDSKAVEGDIELAFAELCAPQFAQHLDSSRAAAVLSAAVQANIVSATIRITWTAAAAGIAPTNLSMIIQESVCVSDFYAATHQIIWTLTSLPAAQQLSSNNITDIVTVVILRHSRDRLNLGQLLDCILQLGPAQQLPAAAVVALVDKAVGKLSYQAAARLLELPTAQHISTQTVVRWLREAVLLYSEVPSDLQPADPQFLRVLLELPAAVHISAAAAEDIMSLCVEIGDVALFMLPHLCAKLPAISTDGLVRLLTAVMHQQDAAAVLLLGTPAAQHIHEQQLLPLLEAAVKRAAADNDIQPLQLLVALPAADYLERQPGLDLLHLAVFEQCPAAVTELFDIATNRNLTAAEVGTLLQAAMQRNLHEVVMMLLEDEKVQGLNPEVVFDLLKLGMELRLEVQTLKRLCGLLVNNMEAASSRSSSSSGNGGGCKFQPLADAYQQAVEGNAGDSSPCQQQQQHSAAGQQAEQYAGMCDAVLDLAIQHNCLQAVGQVLTVQALVAVLDSSRVQLLLTHAVQQQAERVVDIICTLPAAAAVPAAAVQDLLMAAVQRGFTGMVDILCQLPAAAEIGPTEALLLLCRAYRGGFGAIVMSLPELLPAVQQLDGSSVYELIGCDMRLLAGLNIDNLVMLPGAQDLTAGQVLDLIQCALVRRQLSSVVCLCLHVPAAQSISSAAAESLLQLCITARWLVRFDDEPYPGDPPVEEAADALFTLPGVQQLGTAAVQALRAAAETQANAIVVERLVHLPAAAGVAGSEAMCHG